MNGDQRIERPLNPVLCEREQRERYLGDVAVSVAAHQLGSAEALHRICRKFVPTRKGLLLLQSDLFRMGLVARANSDRDKASAMWLLSSWLRLTKRELAALRQELGFVDIEVGRPKVGA